MCKTYILLTYVHCSKTLSKLINLAKINAKLLLKVALQEGRLLIQVSKTIESIRYTNKTKILLHHK